jgi:hypothetical protein
VFSAVHDLRIYHGVLALVAGGRRYRGGSVLSGVSIFLVRDWLVSRMGESEFQNSFKVIK